uniref:DNA mismatch repair proteins mutS family domain-containing protein n=1 Tax=Panagrolaimus sp. PS1159 TaxID=55785 RepID=A0AC35GJE8_9BILA
MGGLVKLSTFYHKILYTNISTNDNFLVPAELMKLTPVDRVFSQISAYDSSSAGQSTFEVELDETSSIINNATRDSFVVIDELGRGIPTNDGTAVFGAILNELANNIQCRTFSSTHYITLCELVQNNPKIRLAHMNFIIENKSEPENEDIAVLYKLVNGACMKTCGFFAGKLAGIPNSVLKEAATGVNLLAEQEKKYETNRTKFVATQENLQTFHELSQLCSGKEIDVTAVTNLIDTL